MSDTITLPAPNVQNAMPPRTKWEQEFQAFRRLFPDLLTTYHGHYVAMHEGQVVESGDDKLAVALRVLAKIGNVPIHVGFVGEEPELVARSGVRRELRPSGDFVPDSLE
jgi:hypothetical protein